MNNAPFLPLWAKVLLGLLWLGVAYVAGSSPVGRRVVAGVGGLAALAHLGAIAGGLLHEYLNRSSGEPLYIGFFAGAVLGALVGLGVGLAWSRIEYVYWGLQLTAVAFLIFYPLVSW